MKRLKLILKALSVLISAFAYLDSYAQTQDCSELAGVWSQKQSEIGEIPTVIQIKNNCEVAIVSSAPRFEKDPLIIDHLFIDAQSKWRIQYSIRPGTRDENDQIIQLPLPADVLAGLQGTLQKNDDGTISLRMDMIDDWCAERSGRNGKPIKCVSPKYYRK